MIKYREFSLFEKKFILVDCHKSKVGCWGENYGVPIFYNYENEEFETIPYVNVKIIGFFKNIKESEFSEIIGWTLNDKYKDALVFTLYELNIFLNENPVKKPNWSDLPLYMSEEDEIKFFNGMDEWKKAEENVFHNPLILKKI